LTLGGNIRTRGKAGMKKLKLKRQTIRELQSVQLTRPQGGLVADTEPYSFCGLCIPVTQQSCNGWTC